MSSITIEYVNALCEDHNARIDRFINDELPKLLEAKGHKVKNHRCNMIAWFDAQTMIKKQNFYEKAYEILKPLREAGFDVKIDMQTYKLSCYGRINEV